MYAVNINETNFSDEVIRSDRPVLRPLVRPLPHGGAHRGGNRPGAYRH